MTTNSDCRPVLNYHRHKRQPAPNPLLAMLLLLPGGICWFCYGLLATRSHLLNQMPIFIPLGLLSWPVAVIAAIASFIVYLPRARRKVWYVWINLAVNFSGLVFTIACLVHGGVFTLSHG